MADRDRSSVIEWLSSEIQVASAVRRAGQVKNASVAASAARGRAAGEAERGEQLGG